MSIHASLQATHCYCWLLWEMCWYAEKASELLLHDNGIGTVKQFKLDTVEADSAGVQEKASKGLIIPSNKALASKSVVEYRLVQLDLELKLSLLHFILRNWQSSHDNTILLRLLILFCGCKEDIEWSVKCVVVFLLFAASSCVYMSRKSM